MNFDCPMVSFELEIQNLIAIGDVEHELDLKYLSQFLEFCIYQPCRFPELNWRSREFGVTVTLFGNEWFTIM
ncbi:MAG: hypothetical protein GF411_13090 [Candidatus Lokiarchaeota archaeon]|nr:hypothetical protein [Candidatus Lokiarchaeota archaeon]